MIRFDFPHQVNERAARVLAALVAVLIVTATVTRTAWLLPLVAAGFLLRVCFGPRYSPLARLAVYVAPKIASVRLVAGPPKRFAQFIGAVCLVTATMLVWVAQSHVGWALAGLVAVFATCEAALGFCMGCWLYSRLVRLGLIAPDRCEDCLPSRPQQPSP